MSEDARARTLDLLKATHRFPGEYHLSVITVTEDQVFSDLRAAVEEGLPAPLAESKYERLPSKGGKYTSHRIQVPCDSAEDVLALYARLSKVRGVVTML